jgi:NAD(P)-dependent dehydrogenase (short-subunit alcohol dehydrogenase family)
MMGWLDGEVALVTGGGSGIGRAVVERYIEEGARVAVMDRAVGRAEELKGRFGDKAIALGGDVSRLDDNKRAVAETVAAFGRLDIFVGNAGVLDGFLRLTDLPEDKLSAACDELFAINVKGCILGAKAALAELDKSKGCMIFTASGAGFTSAGGGVIYTASKHAVVGIVRQLAVELGPNIRVNGVAPGGTMTDLRSVAALSLENRSQFAEPGTRERIAAGNPLQLALEPADLAGAYVFLASRENARGITGSIIGVDAGSILRPMRRS